MLRLQKVRNKSNGAAASLRRHKRQTVSNHKARHEIPVMSLSLEPVGILSYRYSMCSSLLQSSYGCQANLNL
jgi:hypothetical protein